MRGGGDNVMLRFWDDGLFVRALLDRGLHLFTAVGHSDRLLLADKYADESFPTPTAFGEVLGQSLAQIERERRLYIDLEATQVKLSRQKQFVSYLRAAAVIALIVGIVLGRWWLHK